MEELWNAARPTVSLSGSLLWLGSLFDEEGVEAGVAILGRHLLLLSRDDIGLLRGPLRLDW